jgi:hypothetical protein
MRSTLYGIRTIRALTYGHIETNECSHLGTPGMRCAVGLPPTATAQDLASQPNLWGMREGGTETHRGGDG